MPLRPSVSPSVSGSRESKQKPHGSGHLELKSIYATPKPNRMTGFASPAESEREAPLSLDRKLIRHPAATYIWQAASDWPEFHIQSGDWLLVDRAYPPAVGIVVLGVQSGQFCLGRLQGQRHHWRLNQRLLGPEDEIWGVVTHVIHSLGAVHE